jgi:ribosomal protein S18 acetylase RimI-like enzyme
MNVSVTVADEATSDLVAALTRLLPQLSSSAAPPTPSQVEEIVTSPATQLLVARIDGEIDGEIVGALTLVVFRIPSGVRAWIEDVVVDEATRGKGVGEALNREAVRLAAEQGAKTVELTSRPSREVANRLYQRLGFKIRDTNVYRYDLG